jgi:Flp pilus assembly CpaF family ATPase
MELWLFDHSENTRTTLNVTAEPITIGRDADCDIVLPSAFVARKHARLSRKGNLFHVQNLGRSGTRVANREVMPGEQVRVDFGDEIQIAQFSLAMIRPEGRRAESQSNKDTRKLQSELMAFEKRIHSELLERMNLRATGHLNKGDTAFVQQVLEQLDGILDTRVRELRDDVLIHSVHMHLHRLVIADVVRQCQGRVQTDYQDGDALRIDSAREQTIGEIVASFVDMMPLIFDPNSINEDLTVAEEAFDDLFEQMLPTIGPDIRRYIVRRTVSKDIQDIMFGLGPLQDLLEMANVTEIMVVGKDRIYVEKNGVIQPTTRSFFSDDILLSVIERILTPVGRRVDHSTPLVDARLQDGSRVNVLISPLSLVGPCLTIRKFSWIPFTIDDLIERSTLSATAADFLHSCVLGRKNIIISGGTGSGKTTLLNTLSAYCRPNERIITVEESAELRLPQPHVVGTEGRPANVEGRGAYTIRELVRNALRMRPDRIIVGEVRGAEALDMLQAMNTGHDGSLSTLHANTPVDAVKRLETLVLMAIEMPIRAIRDQIVAAIDVIVQVARFADGRRRVTHISEVIGIEPETGNVRIEDIFTLRRSEQPRLRHTGYIPTFTEDLIAQKLLTVEVFL